MTKSRPKSRVRSTIIKLALVVLIYMTFMLSLWLFEWPQFGDRETQVDAPAEIHFDINFRQSELDDIPSTEWPDFRLIIAPEDVEALGSLTEIPFEWNPNGAPATLAILVTANYWQDTQEQVIDGFADFADQAADLMPQGKLREAMAVVPEEVVDTMTITGTVADCAARIAEYEGLADEIIAFRIAQPNQTGGMADYQDLFELAGTV